MNLEIRKFRQKIVNDINEAELPIEVKRLVLKEVMSVVNETADNEIAKEQEILTQKANEEVKTDEQSVQQDNVGELSE